MDFSGRWWLERRLRSAYWCADWSAGGVGFGGPAHRRARTVARPGAPQSGSDAYRLAASAASSLRDRHLFRASARTPAGPPYDSGGKTMVMRESQVRQRGFAAAAKL